ncbi:MAG TPA: ATP-binding protein [Candidatus Eisenbacteria bacterium]|nr:ATP-binding protein [Candidatus Eisenbacteria bacterium]
MSWLSQPTVLAIVLGYLLFLFLVASVGEAFAARLSRGRIRTVTYVLAASVYCTAWTFYGSVGLAANRGLEFLTIYLGPALVALLWPVVLRKLVRVSKEQRITSISDFISSRYGKSAHLGTLVALLVVAGMIPYIALQLRAVSASFRMIVHEDSVLNVLDPTLLVAVTLAFFGILFGARNLDFTKQQTGLMTAVAAESVVKLVAFLAVGVYVTWGLFGGLGEIFGSIARDPVWSRLLTLDQPQTASYARWAAMLVISMMAVMFLPRQFHVLVVQNPRERDVNAVAWSFPLYLLLINLFVLPIAFAGLIVFPESGGQADSFILQLPLHFQSRLISITVFLGGFSAATAMIVVDSLALSKMITNDVILPMLLRRRRLEDIYWITLFYTRVAMLAVVGLGFAWARMERGQLLLVEMGLLSFIAVTQCAPAILLGLYWRRGNRKGAAAGISAGFALWFYTLIIPALVKEGLVPGSVLEVGPFGLDWLNPTALLGLSGLDVTTHGVFWSLFVNVGSFVLVSLLTEQDADDRSQAAAFVGAPGEDKHLGAAPAILSATEIERLVHNYVGDEEAEGIVRELFRGKAPAELSVPELLELRIRFERLLAASLGAAAARMIVEDHFTISKGEAQELVTSFQQMQQSLRLTEEEVRRGERLLALVVQSVDDCIVTAGVDGRLVTMNRAGHRLLGYTEPQVGRLGLSDLLGAEERGRATKAIARAVEAGQGWSGQVTARTANGEGFPAYVSVRAIVDADGQIIGAVGVLRDLTEQVETQRRRIQREKLASLGEMAAGVAHEIRNPLGGIKMATNLLSSGNLGGGALSQEMARSILSGIMEIERIINSLLDFTRDTKLERGEYEVARILDPVVETVATEGRARGVELGYGRVDREVTVSADGQRLRQVFANVMKNALEAIDLRRADGRVTVNLLAEEDRAVVEVIDNGSGIAPENREKIFLPFFTTKPSGTGLGMAIVKKIVDLHGGDVGVESAPGSGTRVRISLPAVVLAPSLVGGTS